MQRSQPAYRVFCFNSQPFLDTVEEFLRPGGEAFCLLKHLLVDGHGLSAHHHVPLSKEKPHATISHGLGNRWRTTPEKNIQCF